MIAISEGYFSAGIAQFWHEIIAILCNSGDIPSHLRQPPFDGTHQDSDNNEQGLKSSGQGLVKPRFCQNI